ncbi:MAG: HEAT repeat domain-containing protein [Nitrospirae bacterium]|nr:HEAT repeat domain-containing protein [Nitrospirota bacterium]
MNKYTPECPFCAKHIERPADIKTEFGPVLAGRCGCGGVYVCDTTGHNTGEAYMECLALAKGDWEMGSMQDTDYHTDEMDYDIKRHARIYSKSLAGGAGKLIFVKMGQPQSEEIKIAEPDKESAGVVPQGRIKTKDRIHEWLKVNDLEPIGLLALTDKSVIKSLISLSYDKDSVLSWRAMEALGVVAKQLSRDKVEVIRDAIRRLLWSMGEESGGIGWSAAEMLGEIIMNNPEAFSDIVPIVWSFKDEEMFRAGVVRALGRVGSVRPDLVRFAVSEMRQMLNDPNPNVRAQAAWALGVLKDKDSVQTLADLCKEEAEVDFYQGGELYKSTVGRISADAKDKCAQ